MHVDDSADVQLGRGVEVRNYGREDLHVRTLEVVEARRVNEGYGLVGPIGVVETCARDGT